MPNLVTQYGRALYGARWRVELAEALGVSERTVRRWEKGTFEPPPGVLAELRAIAKQRAAELCELSR